MRLLLAIVCATACGTVLDAYAAACDNNFNSSGNFLIGTTYKTVDELPAVNSNSAFDGALADISSEPSWKVLSANKATGDIQAVNADSYAKGKSIPFNVHIDANGSGSKISLSYVTSPGVMSPETAIRAQFCKTIAAAASFVSSQPAKGQAAAAVNGANNAGNGPRPLGEAASNMSRTNEYWKNGLPCIAEICVGDGISSLKKVQWDRAAYGTPPGMATKYFSDGPAIKGSLQVEILKNSDLFRGDLKNTVVYLNNKGFDGKFLMHAHSLVACRGFANWLGGRFTSKSGNPTEVAIGLEPIPGGGGKQEWIVTAISRTFPQVKSNKQMDETVEEMQKRYGSSRLSVNTDRWDATRELGGNRFAFILQVPSEVDELKRQHPLCGGTAKVNVD